MAFSWGDSVVVVSVAPKQFRPNQIGEVVGFYRIESEEVASVRGYPIGTLIYTIEFPEGGDVDVPESYLQMLP